MSNTFGERIRMTIFGESHGPAIGLVIDGLEPGMELSLAAIEKEMARRAPGKNAFATARSEKDSFIIQSGIFEGRTTGAPVCVLIPNSDTHSSDYNELKNKMRPGHADYPAYVKFDGCNDYRGGGAFSGRLTAPLVFLGAVAKQYLMQKNILVGAHIAAVAGIADDGFNPLGEEEKIFAALAAKEFPVLNNELGMEMQAAIAEARSEGDSVGGSVECMVTGLPAGIGSPFFDSVESRLAHVLFSIPAVKAVEFGAGTKLATLRGNVANDAYYYDGDAVKTRTNNNGGILGGITNGMPLLFKVSFKPTPSIAQEQETVDVAKGENTVLSIKGRHDPCIVPRAVPVVEAAAAWTVLDMLLAWGK